MAKKKSRQRNSQRVSNRKHSNDISTNSLMVMVVLVLVVSVLSATMYVYAFYGSSNYTKIQKSSSSPVIEEKPAASGMATIDIIKPPESSEK